MPERVVIANTSPLLYLHQVGHLDLLRVLYKLVIVPPAVRVELQAGVKAGIAVPDLAAFSWIEIRTVQSQLLIPAIVDLGPGEAEVIGLGLEHPGSLLILDDQLARRVAALNHLAFTGTLGVVLKAKQSGYLAAAGPVLERLRSSGLWLRDELVTAALRRAGE
jgi:predicted nucleic acid-binding protein